MALSFPSGLIKGCKAPIKAGFATRGEDDLIAVEPQFLTDEILVTFIEAFKGSHPAVWRAAKAIRAARQQRSFDQAQPNFGAF